MEPLSQVRLDQALGEKEYRKQLKKCRKELAELHNELYRKKVPVVIVYEGWDAAGKGGNIKPLAILDFHGVTRKYPVLLMICILMLLVYILIFYTFQTAGDAMERERIAGNMKEQILLQKKQYEFYLQKREAERIFRHDARHRDSILISYLENGEVEGAKEFLKKELAEIEKNAKIPFCENTLINAVLSEYRTKAEQEGLEFSARIQMPKELACDEAEFCVMLSNLLENSLDAAKSYIAISIKHLNHQLSLNVKNDYEGELKKSAENNYLTTKPQGSGLGLKSVEAILKSNSGFLKIEDTDGVFDVFATLKN